MLSSFPNFPSNGRSEECDNSFAGFIVTSLTGERSNLIIFPNVSSFTAGYSLSLLTLMAVNYLLPAASTCCSCELIEALPLISRVFPMDYYF